VEDDLAFGTLLQQWFRKNGFEAELRAKVEPAKRDLQKFAFDLLLTDLRLPDGDGIMLLAWVREQKIPLPVIIMTSYAEVQSAVAAIKLGAFDYLEKPINPSILKPKIEQALASHSLPVQPVREVTQAVSDSVEGKSKAARDMLAHLKRVAPTRLSVLITGESGTGKEYAARLIHEHSPRKHAPFLAVDCGSLSRELAPSELFGHLKGSFTSATADKKGVFEQAKGGTVFLDEVGNLSYEVQMQLLRALQEKKVRPVGAAADIAVDVRIIVATNENLEQAIAHGKFREDLYYRLNEFSITMPPLRERTGDLPIFAQHFLQAANEELGKHICTFSAAAMQTLESHHWSGNLRELRNVIRRAVLFAETDEITEENLPVLAAPLAARPEPPADMALYPENEKEQIEAALKKARGNKTVAALLLKIDRKTLYNKMHQYGIAL
jgi:two-component system response regulator HydG